MKVEQLMTRNVRVCHADDMLNAAAQIMWENDCGCVPVVDEANRVVGMLTDRDICMAAYFQGEPLNNVRVASAMSREVFGCRPDDTVAAAEALLRMHQIRRLPVADTSGALIGILSMNDIACEAERERRQRAKRQITMDEVAMTMSAVCQHRGRELVPAA
jgi:CBS domain-containing protein